MSRTVSEPEMLAVQVQMFARTATGDVPYEEASGRDRELYEAVDRLIEDRFSGMSAEALSCSLREMYTVGANGAFDIEGASGSDTERFYAATELDRLRSLLTGEPGAAFERALCPLCFGYGEQVDGTVETETGKPRLMLCSECGGTGDLPLSDFEDLLDVDAYREYPDGVRGYTDAWAAGPQPDDAAADAPPF